VVATMYSYGPSGQPVWYIAALEAQPTPSTWSGDLYTGTGPWFGTAPFDPSSVSARKVGTMTWTARSVESGTLAYEVDGVAVAKTIHRQTLRHDDYAGSLTGAVYFTRGCGPLVFEFAHTPIFVTHDADRLVVKAAFDPGWNASGIYNYCTFTGGYAQFGHFGRSEGTFACEDGSHGTHRFTDMTVQTVGWTRLWSALLNATDSSGCTTSGHLFGTSGPTPLVLPPPPLVAPTCTISPWQTVSANTSVTLALTNCSTPSGGTITYSWNRGGPGGTQVGTSATYTTPPLTATATFYATASANGLSAIYATTVSVTPATPIGDCSQYTAVSLGDLAFNGAQVDSDYMRGSVVAFGRIVIPDPLPAGWAGKTAQISVFGFADGDFWKKVYLSKTACDFTAVPNAWGQGTGVNLYVTFGAAGPNAVTVQPGEVWYLNVKNETIFGTGSCGAALRCNFAVRAYPPNE